MSVKEYNELINKKFAKIADPNGALYIAAASTLSAIVDRIFEEGKNAEGSGIGQYSTTATYINPKYSPRKFPAKGKTGKTTFKNKKKHKTGYFGGGYKEFKGVIGRDSSKVNLKLTGGLQIDFSNSLKRRGNIWVAGTKNAANTAKAEGNEERFGAPIFKATKAEKELYNKIYKEEVLKIWDNT